MIGIDLINIKRFEKFYKKFQQKALDRFLSTEEIKLSKKRIETLAGFYAAKEAVSKALGCGIGSKLSFHDIHIHKTQINAPYFTLPKHIVQEYKITETSLSITHEKEYAIAVVYIKASDLKKLFH